MGPGLCAQPLCGDSSALQCVITILTVFLAVITYSCCCHVTLSRNIAIINVVVVAVVIIIVGSVVTVSVAAAGSSCLAG